MAGAVTARAAPLAGMRNSGSTWHGRHAQDASPCDRRPLSSTLHQGRFGLTWPLHRPPIAARPERPPPGGGGVGRGAGSLANSTGRAVTGHHDDANGALCGGAASMTAESGSGAPLPD